jgi:hypothetical protein
VRHLLGRDRLCLEIARYLARHPDAADTVRGVAAWWVRHDVPATEVALLRLVSYGVVRCYPLEGATVYAYARDAGLRQAVNQCLRGLAPVAVLEH